MMKCSEDLIRSGSVIAFDDVEAPTQCSGSGDKFARSAFACRRLMDAVHYLRGEHPKLSGTRR